MVARGRQAIMVGCVLVGVCATGSAWAEQYIFLNDGKVIPAERAEIVGDRVRFETSTGAVVEIPRADVTSIHEAPLPGGGSPSAPQTAPPAGVYGSMTEQMNDLVRKEIQQGRGTPGHP